MEITLEEAYTGKAATLKLPTSATCEACAGSGAKKGSRPKVCATCAGQGRVRAQQGFFAIERTCPTCQGRGEIIENPCPSCAGSGRKTLERTLSVNVPAGVEDGTGSASRARARPACGAARPAILYIFLSVKPHAFFQRDGADLYCRVPISMVRAAIGGEITVHAIDSSECKLKVPEGTQSGRQLKVKGKGMPVLRGRDQGDLHVQISVETPQNLTKRQRELLHEFEQESSHHTHPRIDRLFRADERAVRKVARQSVGRARVLSKPRGKAKG